MLDYGFDVQEAIDMPRGLHSEGIYQLEDSVPAKIVEGLKKIGHKTTSVIGPLGGGQAIWIDSDKGTLTGGSIPARTVARWAIEAFGLSLPPEQQPVAFVKAIGRGLPHFSGRSMLSEVCYQRS